MIRSVLAVLQVSLRQYWATRSILWLFMAASIPSLLFPFILQGDGTPEGRWQMVLLYTPVAIFAVTLTSAIWMAAYILASERMQLRLSMLRTKPVSGFSVWLGKWMATCIAQAIALLLGFSLLLCMIWPDIANNKHQQLATWHPFSPDETSLHHQAGEIMHELQNQTDEQDHAALTINQVVNRLKLQKYRVAPGNSVDWKIPISPTHEASNQWQLRFQWRLDPMQRTPVSGTWLLHAGNDRDILAKHKVQELMDGDHVLTWPDLELPHSIESLTLTFLSDKDNTSYVFFSTQKPVLLCQKSGSFFQNILIAALLILACCASAAAVSLTVSSYLSFPVTVFATHGILFAIFIASVAGRSPGQAPVAHHHGSSHNALFRVARGLLDQLHMLTASLRDILPFERLTNSIAISYREHMFDFISLFIILPLVMGLLAHIKYMREEVTQ